MWSRCFQVATPKVQVCFQVNRSLAVQEQKPASSTYYFCRQAAAHRPGQARHAPRNTIQLQASTVFFRRGSQKFGIIAGSNSGQSQTALSAALDMPASSVHSLAQTKLGPERNPTPPADLLLAAANPQQSDGTNLLYAAANCLLLTAVSQTGARLRVAQVKVQKAAK